MHRLSINAIKNKIDTAKELASLRSINQALGELLQAETSVTSQIAEIIRRDPSLTSRLLRLVNSALFSLSEPVHSIEEAVLYLGLRQIKQLAIATPVIEDLQDLQSNFSEKNWDALWQHAIASAILSREILSLVEAAYDDDTDYILGLVHNIGSIVIASLFPDAFTEILDRQAQTRASLCELEDAILGWDHAQIGAYYLKRHGLSEELSQATAFHHNPILAGSHQRAAAAVQVADHLARSSGILGLEATPPLTSDELTSLEGWQILFGCDPNNHILVKATLKYSLERLPHTTSSLLKNVAEKSRV